MKKTAVALIASFLVVFAAANGLAETYATKAAIMRALPSPRAQAVDEVDANQTVSVVERKDGWVRVRLGVDVMGWLPSSVLSDTWIKVWKRERKLFLVEGDLVTRTVRIALGARNPIGPKIREGDGATPEGRFFIGELDAAPAAERYGARSMRLSYPTVADARRGLRDRLIGKDKYLAIVRAVRAGEVPPQHTALGGSIRIHGGGSQHDWTLGCIGLDDQDAVSLFAEVQKGTRVDIYASADQESELAKADQLSRAVVAGAKAQIEARALYTAAAMRVVPMSFPEGDIPARQAVCTDIVVRALRSAGLDLQAMVFEDRTLHPNRYPRPRETPRPVIDHRRVGNLTAWLRRHARAGAIGSAQGLGPGDIVVFETGIRNGSDFDHIGIVDDVRDSSGHYHAINIWTMGWRTSSMPLLGKDYPTVTAWFRLGNALAYR